MAGEHPNDVTLCCYVVDQSLYVAMSVQTLFQISSLADNYPGMDSSCHLPKFHQCKYWSVRTCTESFL